MAQVGLRAFKADPGRYLREVRNGESLQVVDRGRVIAEVSPPKPVSKRRRSAKKQSAADAQVEDLIARGLARPPIRPNRDWVKGPLLRLPPGTAQRLIDEDRGD